MRVEVKFYALIREATGRRREEVELPAKSSVADLLSLIAKKYGEDMARFIYNEEGKVRNYLSYMLNGYNIYSLSGPDTPLKDGDVLAFLPPIGGG
jgi:molybdopterin synthase sulfur carrier subunit